MLHIAFCIAFFIVTVSVVLAQTIESYTKCVQVGAKSVNNFPFLNRNCISAVDGALMCTEVAECTTFTYDDLTKICHLYQNIDTVNCDMNKKNGEITFTKKIECPIDWKKLGNSCYYYEDTTELSWDDASEYCISQGGYLAEVTNEAEFELLNSMINADVYIGCRHYNGKWQWTTSGKELLLTDTLWTPGEPREDECVQIWKGKKCDDTLCYNLMYFLCEKLIERQHKMEETMNKMKERVLKEDCAAPKKSIINI